MKAAHEAIKIQCKAQMELAEEVGSTVKREYCHEVNDEELRKVSSNFSSNEAHLSFVCKAITAVNRTIVARLKWNFTCAATFGTCSFK